MKGRTCGRILVAAVLVFALSPAVAAGETGDITDPYEVLAGHYRALGGLDRLKEEATLHFTADFSLTGLTGVIEHWEVRPDRRRTDA